jgi:hypothetical protein
VVSLKLRPLYPRTKNEVYKFNLLQLIEIHQRFEGTYCLHLQSRTVSEASNKIAELEVLSAVALELFLLLSASTMKLEALLWSEVSMTYYRTVRRQIPEDSTLHRYRCENLKSISFLVFNKTKQQSESERLASFGEILFLAEA